MNPPVVLSPAAAARRETRRRPLGHFFAPEVIAVIGASAKEGSVGRALLAIRPYPGHYATTHPLSGGTTISLRAIRPEDEPLMVRFHETLSDQSVYYRYFTSLSLEQRTSHARLARLCFIDYDREVALVVVHDDPVSGKSEILAVGRLCRAHGRNEAEFAIVVSDRWQRRGIGAILLRRLVQIGREEKLALITGTVLAENHEMRRLCERIGFTLKSRLGDPEFEATLAL